MMKWSRSFRVWMKLWPVNANSWTGQCLRKLYCCCCSWGETSSRPRIPTSASWSRPSGPGCSAGSVRSLRDASRRRPSVSCGRWTCSWGRTGERTWRNWGWGRVWRGRTRRMRTISGRWRRTTRRCSRRLKRRTNPRLPGSSTKSAIFSRTDSSSFSMTYSILERTMPEPRRTGRASSKVSSRPVSYLQTIGECRPFRALPEDRNARPPSHAGKVGGIFRTGSFNLNYSATCWQAMGLKNQSGLSSIIVMFRAKQSNVYLFKYSTYHLACIQVPESDVRPVPKHHTGPVWMRFRSL